jgi:hypothetical protein
MDDHTPPTEEQLAQIEARAAAALHCPNAAANGRLDGQHTLTGSFTTIRCELCDYSRPRGERAEETAALVDEVRRLRAELTSERERYKAGLRRADEHVNAMSEELKRYADGKETPVLWSVYNEMHLRAVNAEALIAAVRAKHKQRTERHGSGCVQCGIVWPCPTYKELDVAIEAQPAAEDTLPAWLVQRFDPRGPDWGALTDEDRAYWEHQAAAVRRAVARGGFKAAEPAAVSAAGGGE